MRPEQIVAVDRSWAELRRRRAELVEHLETSLGEAGTADEAALRARWLVDAVAALVGLLAAPSRLEVRARRLAGTWPVALAAPTFGVDGQAWMCAARELSPSWSNRAEDAWRHAWLLLSDVLAQEALSPFTDPAAGRK